MVHISHYVRFLETIYTYLVYEISRNLRRETKLFCRLVKVANYSSVTESLVKIKAQREYRKHVRNHKRVAGQFDILLS